MTEGQRAKGKGQRAPHIKNSEKINHFTSCNFLCSFIEDKSKKKCIYIHLKENGEAGEFGWSCSHAINLDVQIKIIY